jgi:hypothetical protein
MSEFDRRTREYVLELITTLKTTRNRIASAEAGRDRWAERERLAGKQGREDLAAEAARRRAEEEEKLNRLRNEERQLAAEAEGVQSEWTRAGIRAQLNVDAERLLASLERIAGAPDNTAEELADLEIDSELSRLKEELETGAAASDAGSPGDESSSAGEKGGDDPRSTDDTPPEEEESP